MTKLYQVKRGVRYKVLDTCGQCMHKRDYADDLIICGDENSEHFGHVMIMDHPACEKYESIEDRGQG